MAWEWSYRPYVSVAQRRAKAQRNMDKLRKQGVHIQGIEIEGRKIARTFWGQAWCQHLESFSDYENRLPRGRTYVRNGSVCHLEINAGEVKAIVSGSELYDVKIVIKPLSDKRWCSVKERCSGKIGSLLELLQGRLSTSVMTVVADRQEGLFPHPTEITLNCSCPDWADMCKHVAAVLYGVGARLDEKPDLLFFLRGVDHEELIAANAGITASAIGRKRGGRHIAESELADVFDIEMLTEESPKNVTRGQPSKGVSKKSSPRQISTRSQVSSRKETVRAVSAPAQAQVSVPMPAQTITGKTVRELRARLELSQSEFALIIGVSSASVSIWEKKRGRLSLQQRTMSALTAAGKLSRTQSLKSLRQLGKAQR